MSSEETPSMNLGALSRIHRTVHKSLPLFFPPHAATPSIVPGGMTRLLSPLPDLKAKTTIAHAPSNPLTHMNAHASKAPELFYSPDFNADAFSLEVDMLVLRIPAKVCNQVVKSLRTTNLLSTLARVRNILDDTDHTYVPTVYDPSKVIDPSYKRVLLNMDAFPGTTLSEAFQCIPESVRTTLDLKEDQLQYQKVTFTYPYFTSEQILRSLLPQDITVPTSLSLVGHIAHVNLRDEQLPYKFVIGRVLVDKNQVVETVVNKVGMIDNVFRNFKAEILYGKESLVTQVKEHNLVFEFDFSEVYWNSRLHTEHSRVVQQICDMNSKYTRNREYPKLVASYVKPTAPANSTTGTTSTTSNTKPRFSKRLVSTKFPPFVLDLFAGIGPFVLPAAYEGCIVWGGDINPRSSLYMYKNMLRNNLQKPITVFNSCGRKLLQGVAQKQMYQVLARLRWLQQRGVEVYFKKYVCDAHTQTITYTVFDVYGTPVPEYCGEEAYDAARVQELQNKGMTVLGQPNDVYCMYINNTDVFDNTIPTSCTSTSTSTDTDTDSTSTSTSTDTDTSPVPVFYSSAYSNTMASVLDMIEQHHHVPWFHHTIMNLPASAVTFLDMYTGVYKPANLQDLAPLPPVLTQEHADYIESLPVTDEKHDYMYLNTKFTKPPLDITHLEAASTHDGASSSAPVYKLTDEYNEPEQVQYTQTHHDSTRVPCWDALVTIGLKPLTVHCYCFVRSADEYYAESINLAEKELGYKITKDHVEYPVLKKTWGEDGAKLVKVGNPKKSNSTDGLLPLQYDGTWSSDRIAQDGVYIQYVRNVAPLKEMMCVDALLSGNVLCDTGVKKGEYTPTPMLDTVLTSAAIPDTGSDLEEEEPAQKKQKSQ